MASLNNPTVGAKGLWKLKDPFSNYLPINVALTCTAISNYGQLFSMGINPYETYYQKYDIDLATYQDHFDNDGRIIFLKTDNGTVYSFPLHYLVSYPIGTGVNYVNMAIGVRLGALPLNSNLELLLEQIKELCHLNIGIDVQANLMTLSEINLIENAEHERLVKAREAKMKEQTPALAKISQLVDTNKTIQAKLILAEAKVIELHNENMRLKEQLNNRTP